MVLSSLMSICVLNAIIYQVRKQMTDFKILISELFLLQFTHLSQLQK